MNFRTTLILAVLLLGAVIVLVIVNRSGSDSDQTQSGKTGTTDNRGDGTTRKLLDVKSDDVVKLAIRPTAPGAKPVELTKAGDKWSFVQPIAWPADRFSAGDLVNAFVNLKPRGSVDLTDENKKSTGLDQ